MRLLVIQYTGDYRQAFEDVYVNGYETYHAQKYAMEKMADIGERFGQAAFLCCKTRERYAVRLPSGLDVFGAAADPYERPDDIFEAISGYDPTHVVLHAPILAVLKRILQAKNTRVMCIFADYFPTRGIRNFIKNLLTARLLNRTKVEWVANHNVNASRSTEAIGVSSSKIIPWDWPHDHAPTFAAPKTAPCHGRLTAVYVGVVSEAKGVGDFVRGVALVRKAGLDVRAKIAGDGDVDKFRRLADKLEVGSDVDFLGRIAHRDVIPLMRDGDVVVVPSRHNYPEGLPLTIYEAFCSRTPIVGSDHPMFRNCLVHDVSALVYRAGDPMELAMSIRRLLLDKDLYRQLSTAAQPAWERLQIPVKWGDLIERWMRDTTCDREWLHEHRLASGRYSRS